MADEIEDREILWKKCVDETAVRFLESTETARETARAAAIKCRIHRVFYVNLLAPPDSPLTDLDAKKFAAKMADDAEAWLVDMATAKVLEMRLNGGKLP